MRPLFFVVILVSLFSVPSFASDQGGVCRDHCSGKDFNSGCYPVKDPDGFTFCECSSVEKNAPQCEKPPTEKIPKNLYDNEVED